MAKGWGEYWNPVTKQQETFQSPTRKDTVDIKESQIGTQSYWKVKNNPMYQAAADALDVDWDEFIADADASVGLKVDWEDYEPEMGTTTKRGRRKKEGGWTSEESVSYNVEEYERAYADWSNDEDSDKFDKPKKSDFTTGSGLNKYGFAGNNDIYNQIQEFDDWLTKTAKTQSLQKAPIIKQGPKPSDYGMEGDNIFAALGIDKAPGAPKELDVSYKMNLAQAKPSSVTYNTPTEYTRVNLHGD